METINSEKAHLSPIFPLNQNMRLFSQKKSALLVSFYIQNKLILEIIIIYALKHYNLF